MSYLLSRQKKRSALKLLIKLVPLIFDTVTTLYLTWPSGCLLAQTLGPSYHNEDRRPLAMMVESVNASGVRI